MRPPFISIALFYLNPAARHFPPLSSILSDPHKNMVFSRSSLKVCRFSITVVLKITRYRVGHGWYKDIVTPAAPISEHILPVHRTTDFFHN